jgi:hypothetical protein
VLSVGTKLPLVHVVEALTQEYWFPVTKYLPKSPLDLPLRHSPSSLGHLDVASTKEVLHLGRGSPRPPHKVFSSLHTKPEGFGTTMHSLSSKQSLALSTHTKHVQVYG